MLLIFTDNRADKHPMRRRHPAGPLKDFEGVANTDQAIYLNGKQNNQKFLNKS